MIRRHCLRTVCNYHSGIVLKTPNLKKNAVSLALALAFAPAVYAQEATPAEPKMQRVEITGSSIKRTDNETAASVQVLSRKDIERTGEHLAPAYYLMAIAVLALLGASQLPETAQVDLADVRS